MAIHRLAILRDAPLRLSTENDRHVIYLQEPLSGRLTRLASPLAAALVRLRRSIQSKPGQISEAEMQDLALLGAFMDKSRQEFLTGSKVFNPLLMNFGLFSPAPWQPRLEWLARILISRLGAAGLILAGILALWVSAFTNFAFIRQLNDVFSVEALLTFAVMAPFLKLIHELGHVLAATRFGVPVRNAGFLMIAFYPLPFVDCSDADFLAKRSARVIISLGGLFADLAVALCAFFVWHLSDDGVVRQISANIFFFNTVTTLLFNLNPLMKLDGYFALSDVLHRRNFYQEASDANKRLREHIAIFDVARAWRHLKKNVLKLVFSCLSALYKIYIILFIVWMLLPQYLGLGLLAVLWGGFVMFASPLFSTRQNKGRTPVRVKWLWRGGFLVMFGLIACIPLKHRTTLSVALDVENVYTARSAANGVVDHLSPAGPVDKDRLLVRLRNSDAEAEIAFASKDVELYELAYQSSRQANPLGTDAAREQLRTAEDHLGRLTAEAENLEIFADKPGVYWPLRGLAEGSSIMRGDPVGILLPDSQHSILVGTFPEIYANKFLEGSAIAEIFGAADRQGALLKLTDAALSRSAFDPESGSRGFLISGKAFLTPTTAAKADLYAQVTFPAEPIWQHVIFHYHRLRIKFLTTQDGSS